MRKSSPVFPKYEPSNYSAFEFDPEADFSECLNEARKHKVESRITDSPPRIGAEKKKKKKMWKSSILSWWKSEKEKVKSEQAKRSVMRRGYTSGPIHENKNFETVPWRPTSGPLSGLFKAKRADDGTATSYVTLEDSNRKPYGPVYLVT